MSSARDEIFSTLRRSLGVTGQEAPRRSVVEQRLERAPKGLIPKRGQVAGQERVDLFRAQAERVSATVVEVASSGDVPAAIAAYLRDNNLPAAIRIGADLRLKMMPWQDTALEVKHGPSDGNDLAAVSHAFAAIAETGTAVMTSGPENPTTLNFLPDHHIVVLAAKDLASDMEEVWAKVRYGYGKGDMPRTVNFITGPSRSGDIEQTILLGAHGPRRVHVIVVKE
ncbi:MAG: LutC/YkgG family protein [Beijerinckiaceae bacterium]